MYLMKESEKQEIRTRVKKIPEFLRKNSFTIVFFESLATFILCFGICVSTYLHPISKLNESPFSTFMVSCFLYFGLSIAGPFSGGHLNPSVTISLFFAKLIQKSKIALYITSQVAGAILGGMLSFLVLDIAPGPYEENVEFTSILLDGLGEVIGTFIFTFGIIYTSRRNYMKGEYFNYFFISMMLLIGRTFTFRKGCLNPAIGIALQLYKCIKMDSFLPFLNITSIVVGSILGGIIAAVFFNKFYEPLLNQIQFPEDLDQKQQ